MRPPRRSKLKGIRFKSYVRPPTSKGLSHPNRLLPDGQEYNAHDNKKARLRHLRQTCLHSIRAADKDLLLRIALEKLRGLTKEEPEPEYGFLHLLFTAQKSNEDTGAPLLDCINYLVDKYTEAKT